MKWNEGMLRPGPGLILLHCSEVCRLRGAHNSLQKLRLGTAGGPGCQAQSRWRSKHRLYAYLPNCLIRLLGRGRWVGHLQTCPANDRGHITLCIALIFTMYARETQSILAIGYRQAHRRKMWLLARSCALKAIWVHETVRAFEEGWRSKTSYL